MTTDDPFAILASSSPADDRTHVLKQGDTFAIFDHYGDIRGNGLGEQGLFHDGTRFLSRLLFLIGGKRPLFLSSTVKEDNDLLGVDLMNPDIEVGGEIAIPHGTLHVARTKFLWQGVYYEKIRVKNYGLEPVETTLQVHAQADFADIFEVRGTQREAKGKLLESIVDDAALLLRYEGLDGILRTTRVEFSPPPDTLHPTEARFELSLASRADATFMIAVSCASGEEQAPVLSYENAMQALGGSIEREQEDGCRIAASNEQMNRWIRRAAADMRMMVTETAQGLYPYAGAPWYSTAFGRDGIISALECLWCRPELARGVLGYLAATQATGESEVEDAEPGKILHETRGGEMAILGEIPFRRYYGSVDATPLFVMLAAAHHERTADREFLEAIWPNVERALEWIDRHGDRDGGGFVEYGRRNPRGLVPQGWKDSEDSVFHADGSMAGEPTALCALQAPVFAAKRAASRPPAPRGDAATAKRLEAEAEQLRERFEEAFWCEELSTYALALDGEKRPCRVRTSNAGHCLYAGIASPERAERVAETLLHESMSSGWGIRTVASTEVRYNPMSYHNGSIWPHDNAIIAQGFSRYGLRSGVLQVFQPLFDASRYMQLDRLPELYCGFRRRPGEGPALYPVACSPQTWAAASVYALLQAALGIRVSAVDREIRITDPILPPSIRELTVSGIRVGEASADLLLTRYGGDVSGAVLRKEGDVRVIASK